MESHEGAKPEGGAPEAKRSPFPPGYFATALGTMVVLALLAPVTRVVPFPWNLAGVVPIILGAVLNVVADTQFKKVGTTVKPFQTSSILVTGGVFSFSRNPMYLGMVTVLVGVAILLRELTPWIVVPVFAAAIHHAFIRAEERMIEEQFQEVWRSYAARVRRWV